jgi:hypothetical protein
MIRNVLLGLSLALAVSASAAERDSADPKSAGTSQPAPKKEGQKAKGKESSKGKDSAKGKSSGKEEESDAASARRKYEERKKSKAGSTTITRTDGTKVEVADFQAVSKRKAMLMFAVEACERPERCDQGLLEDSEKRFMIACRVCASEAECEADRAAVRAGQSSSGKNPCAQ